MNQMRAVDLHNLLTTHSHLNYYAISQVSSINIQEPAGKIPELLSVVRQSDNRGQVHIAHVGVESVKRLSVSRIVS